MEFENLPSYLFLSGCNSVEYNGHIAKIAQNLSNGYPYGLPEDLSSNDSRSCSGLPVFLNVGEYVITYLKADDLRNVNNYGTEIIRVFIPDNDFVVEFDFKNCPNIQIKITGDHLKKYQKNKPKRAREV